MGSHPYLQFQFNFTKLILVFFLPIIVTPASDSENLPLIILNILT